MRPGLALCKPLSGLTIDPVCLHSFTIFRGAPVVVRL